MTTANRTWSAQQAAVFDFFATGKGNLVVTARAGCAKTTSIIEGVNYAPESDILFCAFNKKIAVEMSDRLDNPRAEAKTLHSVGFAFIRRNWESVKVDGDRGFNLAREAAGTKAPDTIVRLVQKLASLGKNTMIRPDTQKLIDVAYAYEVFPDQEWEEEGWDVERVAVAAGQAMDFALRKDGLVDFDDMVFIPVALGWVRGRYNLVVVDEAQDMNAVQLMLAQQVCKKGGRIVVVGDDRQAIYGFRGADSDSINRLKKELNATELKLTTTYRCPRSVVERAATLVPDFNAAPNAPHGELRECKYNQLPSLVQAGDFVLSRKNAPLVSTCLAILKTGKRARVEGKDVGRGLVSLVKKLSARSIPHFMEKLSKWEAREIERLNATGKKSAQSKIAVVSDKAEMLRSMSAGLTSIRELETRIENLFGDMADQGAHNTVVCSSVHKAKGLEADRVFLLEETFYPGGRNYIEEQNIEYVAVTRSKNILYSVTGLESEQDNDNLL